MPGRLARQCTGDVLAHHETGHGRVSTEVLILHGDHTNIVSLETFDEWSDDHGPVLAREYTDRCITAR